MTSVRKRIPALLTSGCLWSAVSLGLIAAAHGASPLEQAVLAAVQEARFHEVVDFGADNEDRDVAAGSARRIKLTPNVDVAVIQLDRQGEVVAYANVLLSRDYPQGLAVPVTLDGGAEAVRFRRWDIERWNGAADMGNRKPSRALTEADDVVPGRAGAVWEFMAPYPASLFKLMVAFHLMRLVDSGVVTLDTEITHEPPGGSSEAALLRIWLDRMITTSDNPATQCLIQFLHRRSEMDALNRGFRQLGLGTLQINGTRPSDGGGWQPGQIHMTAFDTARLLLVIEGPPGTLWRAPGGGTVTAGVLGEGSRAFLKALLAEQGLNEALSTSNLAGVAGVRPGIPSRIASRWINPANGSVVVHGISYGVDVRPDQARAEVVFAHKTGLTYNYGSDAGIVTSLPGKPFRRYIVVFLGNLGYRYTDEGFGQGTRGPYARQVSPIAYTQRIPALGRAIDGAVKVLSSAGP